MAQQPTLFVYVTAAGAAVTIPQLLGWCVQAGWITYTVASPNVAMVMAVEDIYTAPGCIPIRQYGMSPLDRFPFGTMLVAPCTFNTFNKIAHGVADSLVTAMVADALGHGCPIYIAPAMNHGLWRHPQTHISRARLQHWGCHIIEPQVQAAAVGMAPISDIFAHLHRHFASEHDADQEPRV